MVESPTQSMVIPCPQPSEHLVNWRNSAVKSVVIDADCTIDGVRDAARSIRAFLQETGAEEVEMDQWELIAMEAGTNSVENAPADQPGEYVRFLMTAWPECIELCVTDHSRGFDWPQEVSLPDELNESGRGIYLITALTDTVRYLRGETENFLILRKKRKASRRLSDVQRDSDLETTLQMMTEELGASYESLSAIVRFTSESGRTEDTAGCAKKWLGELLKATQTRWYVFRQFDQEKRFLTALASSVAVNSAQARLFVPLTCSDTDPLEVQAAVRGEDIWFDNTTNPVTTKLLVEIFGQPLSGLVHPIYVGNHLFGVIAIGMDKPKPDMVMGQVNVIYTIADFLGAQLSNAQVQDEAMKARLVNLELEIASGIQRSLLPRTLPQPAGWSVAAYSESARQVGGDLYNVVAVGEHGLLLAIADVMGKGVSAAMFAAIFRSHLKARPDLLATPAKLMTWLNHVLFADLDVVDMFITAQLAYVDLSTRELRLSSAGHCPALLVHGDDLSLHEISGDGPPLGIASDSHYGEESMVLAKTTRLLLFTDGLIECRNEKNRSFGAVALSNWLKSTARDHKDSEAAVYDIVKRVTEFQHGTVASDDITLIMLSDSED